MKKQELYVHTNVVERKVMFMSVISLVNDLRVCLKVHLDICRVEWRTPVNKLLAAGDSGRQDL